MPVHSEKINILLLVPTLDLGGTGNAVLTLAKSLNSARFNTIICSMRKANLRAEEKAKAQATKVINLNMRFLFDIFVIFRLRKVIIREEIDIVHNHGFRPEIYGGIAGRIAKCKGVLATILHNPAEDIPLDYGFIIGRIMNFVRLIFAFFCEDTLIAISEDAKKGLIKLHSPIKKIKVIYSGINPDLLKQQGSHINRKEFLNSISIVNNKFVIGTIATLNRRKGISILIKSAHKIVQDYPNVRFVIIGSGPLENALKEQVKSLNLQKEVIFLGYQKNLVATLKNLDLIVLPSLTEGLPAVLLEAMAFGVPIIATKVGGVPEVIEDGVSGILVSPKNPESLAKAIVKIYREPELASKLAKNARVRFEKYFTANKTTWEYEKIYEELLKR